jgi:hypothetical protein
VTDGDQELANISSYYKVHIQHLLELNAADLELGLPKWMVECFQWHNEMRQKFPDEEILNHPEGPKVMIKHCIRPGKCGGLYDRIKYLATDILIAAMSQRVLLIKWKYPYDLEEFLTPNLLNWTAPASLHFRSVNRYVKALTLRRWDRMDKVQVRLQDTHNVRIIGTFQGDMHRILTEVLQSRNETDFIYHTPTFGILW